MDYKWNWGMLLQPVATGEPTTYLGWLGYGFLNTALLTFTAWILAMAVGSLFDWERPMCQFLEIFR